MRRIGDGSKELARYPPIQKMKHHRETETDRNTLYLHVGTHKTGTSAIQAMLKRCGADLAQQGVNHLHIPAPVLKKALRPESPAELSTCAEMARRMIRRSIWLSRIRHPRYLQNDTFLLSWEGLCGSPIEGYAESQKTAAILHAALERWRQVKVIIFLRRQDLFAESMYAQYIRQGRGFSFVEFMDRLPPKAFDWQRLIQNYSDLFGAEQISVIPYEKESLPDSDSILKIFCQQIGLDFSKLKYRPATPTSDRPNQSWTVEGLRLARLCADDLSEEPKRALRHLLDQVNLKNRPGASLMSSEQRQALLQDYEPSNRAVLETYLKGSRASLFSDPLPQADQPIGDAQSKSDAEARLLAVLMAHLANNQRVKTKLRRLLGRLQR